LLYWEYNCGNLGVLGDIVKNKRKIVFICIVLAATLYFAIWKWFITDGDIPLGSDLSKSDWLGFFGGFLSFLGTTFLGVIALQQTNAINKQKTIEEYRAQVYPSIDSNALIVYDVGNNFDYNSDDWETCVFLHEKGAKDNRIIYMDIPFKTHSSRIPDSVYVEYALIEILEYPEQRCKFDNCNDQFVSIYATENNQFKIIFEFGENDTKHHFFQSMIKAHNKISINLNMCFKIENVITPVICTLFITQFGENDKITNGLIRTKNSYIER